MSDLSTFFNPPAANVPPPVFQTYQPVGTGTADSSALGGISNLSNFNTYGQYLPQAQGITNNLVNNPYAAYYQGGVGTASQMGQAGALNQYGQGGNLYGLAGSIAQTAFDPQNDLYNRTVQQLQDQTRAGEAARGIATTPYGAGLENTNLRNFNIDWQNNQLQRQIQGGQAAGGLTTQGAGLQASAPGQYATASGLPYTTAQTIGTNQFGALNNLGQFGQSGSQIPQQQVQDYLSYLGWATGQTNANNATQQNQFSDLLNQANQGFNQQQTMFGDIGKVAATALPLLLSDARVKDDIVRVGELYDRTPVYSFRYKGDPVSRVGLMAQDVERRRPDAVHEFGGVKAVDYGKATEFSRGIAALSKWAA